MAMTSIGDMRQQFLMSMSNTALKTDLNTLVQELTSGQAHDLTAHLGASQTVLSGFDRQISLLEQSQRANTETAQWLSFMQVSLDAVDGYRGSASAALIAVNYDSAPGTMELASIASRNGLDGMISALNARLGDRALFGGRDVGGVPLASANDMMADITTALSGLSTADDIMTAIEDWFTQSGGGFETSGYLGDAAGTLSRTSDLGKSVEIDVRADDPVLRDTMVAFVAGIVATDSTLPLSASEQRALQQQAGLKLTEAAIPMAGLRGRIGFAEGLVEEGAVRMSAQVTSLSIARNDLVRVDPFETASRLEQVQLTLETQYALTARLSRLSLTEYLR